jgi:hypothetical protein
MTLNVGRESLGDVSTGGVDAIVIALLSGGAERSRRRWGSVNDRLRVRAGGQDKWKSQSNEDCDLSGGHFLKPHPLDFVAARRLVD